MILFVGVGKRLLDLAVNPVPVPSNLGIESALKRPQLIGKVFALVVRTKVPIAHQHLAGFRQRVAILSGRVVILETSAGFRLRESEPRRGRSVSTLCRSVLITTPAHR
jgi:hypothetical protein